MAFDNLFSHKKVGEFIRKGGFIRTNTELALQTKGHSFEPLFFRENLRSYLDEPSHKNSVK